MSRNLLGFPRQEKGRASRDTHAPNPLERGLAVRGIVVDAETGMPVAGARAGELATFEAEAP